MSCQQVLRVPTAVSGLAAVPGMHTFLGHTVYKYILNVCPGSSDPPVQLIYLTEKQSIHLYNNYTQPQLQDPWNEPLALVELWRGIYGSRTLGARSVIWAVSQ